MKNKFLSLALFLLTAISYSQIKCEHFVGKWTVIKKDIINDLITLEKNGKGYGTSIILNKNQQIREVFSAPCGNDTRFFSSAKKGFGDWSYNDKDKIFITTIPIIGNYKVFLLKAFFDNIIILKPLKE